MCITIGSGSLTVSSHASIHTLQLALLILEDSMGHMTAMEAILNVELQKMGKGPVHIPGFLPEEFHDVSAPLQLVSHFHASQATEFSSNHSLSLFGIIREVMRDKKVYPRAEITPISFYDESGEDGSQEVVVPEVNDHDLSPHTLHGKYESIIMVAKKRMAKAEDDIPPPPNQLALHKKEPVLPHVPVSEKQFPKYEACEQEFLIRMVRGYDAVSVDEIKKALPQEIWPSSHIWKAACQNLTAAHQNDDINQCLTLLDLQLLNLAKSATFTHLIDYALYTAANLQYALFDVYQQTQIEELGDDEAAIKTLQKSFTDTHRKTFGISILLDPSVKMHTKTGTLTFSNTFAGTLDILGASLQPFAGILSKHDNNNRIFLVNFLHAVGTKSVYVFIKLFIESLDDQGDK
ncbi:hypothetical protein IW262DRAFT_1300645 [Armillaria fumosa]|nr:hypothetical protein IW262DRAFT_1300645 [Armillaria fumosa]